MTIRTAPWVAVLAAALPMTVHAQTDDAASGDELKIAALEALASAPEARALPLVQKVLAGNHSDEVKERALFVLSQSDAPEARAQLLEFARSGGGELQAEAVRMIGIGGDPEALAGLRAIYESGDSEVKQAVLEAYLIADDSDAVYEIAANATDEEEFSHAVEMLGAMDATDKLRQLRDKVGMSPSLIESYAIAGDIDTLREIARDRSDPELQERAIEGLMIADDDAGLLELYRASATIEEKRMILEQLAIMDSDLVMDVIDEALAGDR